MLFYSYAELVIGLVAVFYFTSKIFSIIKYKIYFALSLIFIILTASFACFIKSDQRYVILPVLHFVALIFLPISLGYNKKNDVAVLFALLFGINIFYIRNLSIVVFNLFNRICEQHQCVF